MTTTNNNQTNHQFNSNSIPNQSSTLIEFILSNQNSSDLNYLETLKKIKPEILLCLSEENNQEEVDVLDEILKPEFHGFGYFVILSMRILFGKFKSLESILKHVDWFCLRIKSEELNKLSIDLNGFIKSLIEFYNKFNLLSRSIETIYNLISKNDEPEVLTTLHSQLMKLALLSREYKRAIELSNLDLIKIDRKNHPIEYQDHLLYHYFAGIIQALNQNYKRSIQLLTITVSAPGSSISQIQIEAYKKLILINLLFDSKSTNLPKYSHSQFKNVFLKFGKVYLDFIQFYLNSIHSSILSNDNNSFEDEKLFGFIEKNLNCFLKDRNYGLVKLCIEVLPRKKILNLISIYKSIPIQTLNRILNESNYSKTINLIQSMISNQEIYAKIETNQVNEEILIFLNPFSNNDDDHHQEIKFNQIIKNIKRFEIQMKSIEHQIERNPDYLKKTLKELKEMEKPIGSTGIGLSGNEVNEVNLEGHAALVQQQYSHQQAIQFKLQMIPVGEEDLGIGLENGWDENESFK